jgi:hypothetical protein
MEAMKSLARYYYIINCALNGTSLYEDEIRALENERDTLKSKLNGEYYSHIMRITPSDGSITYDMKKMFEAGVSCKAELERGPIEVDRANNPTGYLSGRPKPPINKGKR